MIDDLKPLINAYLEIRNSKMNADRLLELLHEDIICPLTLVEQFLEEGGSLFGNPIFDDELFSVFDAWLCNGECIKVSMYARSLLEQLPTDSDREYRQWLEEYANGERINRHGFAYEAWPGHPEVYLENWNWRMHELASTFQRWTPDYRFKTLTKVG